MIPSISSVAIQTVAPKRPLPSRFLPPVSAQRKQPQAEVRFGGNLKTAGILLAGLTTLAVGGRLLTHAILGQPETPQTPSSSVVNTTPQGNPPPATGHHQAQPAGDIDLDDLNRRLQGEGLKGTIHGAVHNSREYVFTYRNPDDFFSNIQMSVVGVNQSVRDALQTLNRHDQVIIKGKLAGNSSPQPHIKATSVEIVKRWTPDTGGVAQRPAQDPMELRKELAGKSELVALVHAVPEEGGIVVLEYKNFVIPLVVPDEAFTKDLWRDDIVKVRFTIQNFPKVPVHIELNTDTQDGQKPVEVLSRIQDLHQKQMTLEGNLVKFPQSPVINRDIWALEQPGENGLNRYFTLFNFEDAEDQKQVDKQLRSWWDSEPQGVVDGRNKFVNTRVKIRATGIVNSIDPNQANPQLTLKSYTDIKRVP